MFQGGFQDCGATTKNSSLYDLAVWGLAHAGNESPKETDWQEVQEKQNNAFLHFCGRLWSQFPQDVAIA